jgi:hypothetical protein
MNYFLNENLKAAILFSFVLFLSPFVKSQDINCKWFSEGDFEYVEAENMHWEVERLGAYQFEHSEKYDVLFVASLEWVDECSYLLQYVSISNSEYFDLYGKLLHCEMIPIDDESYEVVVDDEGEMLTYVMKKLPEENVTSIGSPR